jgi:hypothetical protein
MRLQLPLLHFKAKEGEKRHSHRPVTPVVVIEGDYTFSSITRKNKCDVSGLPSGALCRMQIAACRKVSHAVEMGQEANHCASSKRGT